MKVLKETAFELDMYSVVVGNCVGGDGRWHQKVSKTPVHTHKSDELCLDPRISKERAPGNSKVLTMSASVCTSPPWNTVTCCGANGTPEIRITLAFHNSV